jgi:hypothetical protein
MDGYQHCYRYGRADRAGEVQCDPLGRSDKVTSGELNDVPRAAWT